MSWSLKQIEDLKKEGKISGYFVSEDKPIAAIKKKRGRYKKGAALTRLEFILKNWAETNNLELITEHKFDPKRLWRFDFFFPSISTAVEFEGGVYSDKSGHKTAKHYTKDTDKYNKATVLGFRVIRVTAINYQTATVHLNDILATLH